jgi:hypothetical protein
VRLSPLVTLANCTSAGWWWWWAWNDWKGKPKYLEKTCHSTIFSTTNAVLPGPGSNPGRRGGEPATNRLSYGMDYSVSFHAICIVITSSQISLSCNNAGSSVWLLNAHFNVLWIDCVCIFVFRDTAHGIAHYVSREVLTTLDMKILSFQMWRLIVWYKDTNVSGELATSLFRLEELTARKTEIRLLLNVGTFWHVLWPDNT